MQATMRQKLASYGQWTYRGAWALEVVASIIGLATGIVLGFRGFSASESADSMDLVLASAPFFMVAIAELTKIPIATLLFGVSWRWKPFVLAFLLVLAGITFETVFMGLERAGTLRQLRYEELVGQIDTLRHEADALTAADEEAKNSDEVAKASADYDRITEQASKQLEGIREQVKQIDLELQGTAALTPEAVRVRDQITELDRRRTKRIEERDREAKDAVELFERQRDSFVSRIDAARKSGDNGAARRFEQELTRLVNPRPKIFARADDDLAPIEEQLERLRAQFDQISVSSPGTTDQQRVLLERRTKTEALLESTSANLQRQIDAASKRLEEALAAAETEGHRLAANQARRDEIAKQIAALEQERIPMARTDQVRRIAGRWYGKKPEEVTEAEAGVVSVAWFGSLALIAAVAGPITAMVALGLQGIAAQAEEHESGLSRLLRRMLLRWRWRRVRTVERRVEVPVEKEVEKRIEVPVEIEKVVKEILYVPILTDDPEALRRALDRDLPPEVADLVRISTKDSGQSAPQPIAAVEKALEEELELSLNTPAKAHDRRGRPRARPA